MITFTDAIDQLHTQANSRKAAELKNSIKIDRVYLGISNSEQDNIYKICYLVLSGIFQEKPGQY